MKRIIRTIIIVFIIGITLPVFAEEKDVKELIPVNTKVTVYTKNLGYKELYCNQDQIIFNGIKNMTNKELPISVSIGLFDINGKNIGTINYCEGNLNAKQEMSYLIEIGKEYLGDNVTTDNIRYISIINDNIDCRRTGSRDYIGQSVDQMRIKHKESFKEEMSTTLKVLIGIGIALILSILYKVFTSRKKTNVDIDEIKKEENKVETKEDKFKIEEIKEKDKFEIEGISKKKKNKQDKFKIDGIDE